MEDLLKFVTCGSVDDGKSTLIGHMLYDAKLLYADQAQALELDSRVGSCGGRLDYSLLLDGLLAEREQGITIDVAYRYFSTDRRSFIVADTPGHEEYTRNMAVGASFADLAVLLIDATQGILPQSRRHARICALMGIRHFVFAINKMDLIGYAQEPFTALEKALHEMMEEFSPASVFAIPVSATVGDNVTHPSAAMPWYTGPALLSYLETIHISVGDDLPGFAMPVQRVCRPDLTFRGYQGQCAYGQLRIGDTVTVLPSHETASVRQLLVAGAPAEKISRGQAVTIQLDREIDISRGDVIMKDAQLYVGNQFTASVLWMDDTPLSMGRSYLLRLGTKLLPATIQRIVHTVDVNTGRQEPARQLRKNEIGQCEISVPDQIVFNRFLHACSCDKASGTFLLIDRITNMTSACGTVAHKLAADHNLTTQLLDVTREIRAQQKEQTPCTLWFTGLSGAGKSTLANALEQRLVSMGKHTMLLDGDNIRQGLCCDLGFSDTDREENIRRVAQVARLMNDAGLIVLTAFISPFTADRKNAREIVGEGFVEIYVSTPIEECARRDVKGLYQRARQGEIPSFTGISSPFEPPQHPEITIDTTGRDLEDCVEQLLEELELLL